MLKNRSYLLGIGTGIIVGALLLQVMSVRASAPGKSSLALDEMDPQKLKEEAAKYYQVFDLGTKMYTQAEVDASVQKKVKEETDKLAAAKPQDQPKAETVVRTVVYVQPNLDATAVSELLVKSGLITDRKAFATELQKQGGNTKLQVGFHVFEGQLDMQQVVSNLITSQQ
ncbi:hypothetical protein P5G65_22095 [Paenibacillus chondroitinus]|uniref:Endolytic transglycosylase MltG n=1 Tax=Paenibacillus chondroitinus TaxID=59842 RepID=A0ABU6DFS8_9BACL|nr:MULTISPECIES: hypothetical protein [Paenibacillus]MCY9659061.1 endolytic transglycosylase MltG [Paenibacillus anseongense]MEB4796604.1 hypothetical protein [Paenibacillus chondroitinus]